LTVDDGLIACVDADRLRQAADNLLDNALTHAPSATRIQLTADRQDSQLIIEVADDGPGFAPEFRPHAFERFRRADTARGGAGTGLGLSIVEAVARGHQGTAEIQQRPGGGAIVRLRLTDQADMRKTEQADNGHGCRVVPPDGSSSRG
jgi:two-component system OmpR family sensor kinase